MKETWITTLRDQQSTRAEFRSAAHQLARYLANEAGSYLEKESYSVQSPLSSTTGWRLKNKVVLVPILRSGLALLSTFLESFHEAKVGILGLKRDEVTAIPHLYYQNLPPIAQEEDVLILEPMLATGNTVSAVMDILMNEAGVREHKIMLCSIVSAPEGYERIQNEYPKVKKVILQRDECLNAKKFIVPGLGDFGDRYFGT